MAEIARSPSVPTAPKLPTDAPVLWYYDNTARSGGYLLLNTTEELLIDCVKGALGEAAISCRNEGGCFRPANNGRMYKRFIRLITNDGVSPDVKSVRKAVQPLSQFHFDASPVEVRRYFNWVHDRIDRLEREARELRTIAEKTVLTPPEEAGVFEQMYEDDVARLQGQLRILTNERDDLKLRIDILESEVTNHQTEVREEARCRNTDLDDCLTIIQCLLPRLEFIDDSLSYILTEVKDYKHILRHLRTLNLGETLPFKNFRAAAGWLEVDKHISNGQSNTTRIYYRCRSAPKKIQVLVSDRSEQDHDERRLQRCAD